MAVYHFHKVFRLGVKAGKTSKFPTITVEADSETEAKVNAKSQMKKGVEYIIKLGEDEIIHAPVPRTKRSVQPEEIRVGSNPTAWRKGDPCWYKLGSWEDRYIRGEVTDVLDSPKHGACLRVYGDPGGMRHLKASDVFRNPPDGLAKRVREIELTRDQETMAKPARSVKRKAEAR